MLCVLKTFSHTQSRLFSEWFIGARVSRVSTVSKISNRFLILLWTCWLALGFIPSADASPGAVRINEFVSSNNGSHLDEDGDASDWIEVFSGSESVQLEGWGLSDREEEPFRWVFPSVILGPNQYLLIWASGKDRRQSGAPLHANFAIDRNGESLFLVRPDGTVSDQVDPVALIEDISYGRSLGDASRWLFYSEPTPGRANLGTGFDAILDPPAVSHESAFHTEAFSLSFTGIEPGTTVFYTLDGSLPTPNSSVYRAPLPMGPLSNVPEGIALHPTTPPIDPDAVAGDFIAQLFKPAVLHMPPLLVERAHILRYQAVREGAIPSVVRTKTYWIHPDIHERFSLPVVSIQTDPDGFFDHQRGIYVAGAAYRNNNSGRPWHNPANYRLRGRAWERPIHLGIFGSDGVPWIDQDAGVRMHGGASRSMAQKTLRLYARNDYGNSRFEYPLFSDQPDPSYRRLLLRNSGNDWNLTLFLDALAHRVISHLRIDTQAYRPMIVFLNGHYWGIHNLRERYDRHYLARTYGVDPDALDRLSGSGSVSQGNATHYQALLSFVNSQDLSNPNNWSELQTRMDLGNFMDYFIAQIFTRNTDWPGNNIAYWRARTEYRPNAPPGQDGRWRWLPFDLDFGWGYADGNQAHTHSTLNHARNNHGLFRSILEQPEFQSDFLIRFSDQLNTAFKSPRLLQELERLQGVIQPEMGRHMQRWRRPANPMAWEANVEIMRRFAERRPGVLWTHLQNFAGFQRAAGRVFDVQPAQAGILKVNTVVINSSTLGLDNPEQPYPWTGQFFAELPVTVVAQSNPGFRFDRWVQVPEHSTPSLTLQGREHPVLQAQFVREPEPVLLHAWNFNDPDSPLAPWLSLGGGRIDIVPGADTEIVLSTGQGFDGANARHEQDIGTHLRLNEPVGTHLTLKVPTPGFQSPIVRYEARRSGQGAALQSVSYSIDDINEVPFQDVILFDDDPQWVTLDFTNIPEVANHPGFTLHIRVQQGEGGTGGNQRIDNLTVEALPMMGPPQLRLEPEGNLGWAIRFWVDPKLPPEGLTLQRTTSLSADWAVVWSLTQPTAVVGEEGHVRIPFNPDETQANAFFRLTQDQN